MKFGNNAHGNQNEASLVEALNNKQFSELPLNLKEFIKYICKKKKLHLEDSDIILAKEEPNNRLKQDLYIILNTQSFAVSLKMGSGNSVHQEKCEDFISYIIDEFNANDEVCRAFRLLLWSDGTVDGTGSLDKNERDEIKTRYTSKVFKNKFPYEVKLIQQFLNENKSSLINRFLFIGRHKSKVDFIYHGTSLSGSWLSTEEILSFLIKNKSGEKPLSITRMSIQAWNASIKGTSEHKRGQLQVKYAQMERDLGNLMLASSNNMGTFEGDREEYTLSRILNREKNHPYWRKILPNIGSFSEYYAAVVDRKILSTLSGKKVYSKTDVYIIKKKLPKEILLKNQYLITESDIESCHKFAIYNTGISVKRKDSQKYTFQKLTKNSFLKAISPYYEKATLLLVGLLIYSNKEEMYKNKNILSDFSFNESSFLKDINSNFNTKFNTFDSQKADKIRNLCQSKLIEIIEKNTVLKQAIFTGQGWFEQPYCISFIFHNKMLSDNLFTNYIITTGSGRSKGNYSIEIKPR